MNEKGQISKVTYLKGFIYEYENAKLTNNHFSIR